MSTNQNVRVAAAQIANAVAKGAWIGSTGPYWLVRRGLANRLARRPGQLLAAQRAAEQLAAREGWDLQRESRQNFIEALE